MNIFSKKIIVINVKTPFKLNGVFGLSSNKTIWFTR